jgi:hypothetical protein
LQFGEWEFTCDREATAQAHALAPAGGSDTCTCVWCRNFVLVRDRVYPERFVTLLASLGIDPTKDGEVYHNGEIQPGGHFYGGWFHFVGSLNKTGDFPMVAMAQGFKVWLCQKSAPPLATLREMPRVQLEFLAENVPWVLDEPSPR